MLNRKTAFLVLSVAVLASASAHAQYHIYWGDMHGHTSHSDGKGSLDDYFTHARDVARLDFVVVSDHDFGNAAPWHMPKETWTLTQDKADQYTADGVADELWEEHEADQLRRQRRKQDDEEAA